MTKPANPQVIALENDQAEQAVLGAVMVSPAAFDMAAKHITESEMFSAPVHRRIWHVMVEQIKAGTKPTAISLSPYFEKDEDLSLVGGAKYLVDLRIAVSTIVDCEDNAKLVRDMWLRREIVRMARGIEDAANIHTVNTSGDDLMDRLISESGKVLEKSMGARRTRPLAEMADDALAQAQHLARGDHNGCKTGLANLDRMLPRGLYNGGLFLFAGRPGMGKSAVATQIALNMARKSTRVGFVSLEMGGDQVAGRMLANIAGNGLSPDPSAPEEHWQRMAEARATLSRLPIVIDDQPAQTYARIAAQARAAKRRQQLDCLIIDYVGLIKADSHQQGVKRWERMREVSNDLKALARTLDIPIIALAQLGRQVEEREDKQPMMSDLRDSGSWEEDADAVFLIFREEYYLQNETDAPPKKGGVKKGDIDPVADLKTRKEKAANVMQINIAKNRYGPTGKENYHCDLASNTIRDMWRSQ